MKPIGQTLFAALLLAITPVAAWAQGIVVQQPWARATIGAGKSAVVYFTLLDQGAADRLIGASTPVAGMAMLHESEDSGGVASMKMLDAVDLPAGKTIMLHPGGMHLMLTMLAGPLLRGSSFPLTLNFEHAAPITITVPVLAAGAAGP